MSRAGSRKEEAAFVTAAHSVGTHCSAPGSAVCRYAGGEVTEDNPLVCLRYSRRKRVELFPTSLELAIGKRGVDTDDGGEFGFLKRQAQGNRAVVDVLRHAGQLSPDVAQDNKGDTSILSLCLWAAAPE
ncbi:hypothetical protein SprV_0501821700 [Sparganum proliferum]